MDYKTIAFKAEAVDMDKRIVKGYASTHDLDQGGDIILPGAFGKTLAENFGRVKMCWQHDKSKPIGKPKVMQEDETGLYTETYIARTAQGDDALELVREGIVESLSIGYMVTDEEYNDNGHRIIKALELWEYSLVTWPMNTAAVITGIKSMEVREIERVLRDAGCSRSQAKAIAGAGVKSLREADQQGSEELKKLSELIATFRQSAS